MRAQNKGIAKASKLERSAEGIMELTPTQIALLNLLLPKRYKIDFSEQKNFRSVLSM